MTTQTLFNRDEMIRLSREGLENALRFYMTLNENVIKLAETQREAINENTKKNLETLNRAYDEYQKNNRAVVNRVETFTRDMFAQITPKTTEAGK